MKHLVEKISYFKKYINDKISLMDKRNRKSLNTLLIIFKKLQEETLCQTLLKKKSVN